MAQNEIAPKPRKMRTDKITYDEFLKRYMNGEHLEWVKGRLCL